MLEDCTKSPGKVFLREQYVFCFTSKRIRQKQREQEGHSVIKYDWLEFLGNVRLRPYLEINGCPAKARLIFRRNANFIIWMVSGAYPTSQTNTDYKYIFLFLSLSPCLSISLPSLSLVHSLVHSVSHTQTQIETVSE